MNGCCRTRDGVLRDFCNSVQVIVVDVLQQFRAMGRRDAHDLAVELVASYQGSAILTSTLGQPELMTRQARHLKRWIEALHA